MSLAVKAARQQAVGDPGLFGSIGKFLGGALKTVGGIVGGPVGFGLKTIGGFAGGGPQVTSPAPRMITGRTVGRRGSQGPNQLFGPGVTPFVGPPRPAPAGGVGLACPAGFHPNKSSYFMRSGEFIAKGSKCVPSRRRNPANARANDRAIGRIESAKKMAARLGRISIRKECPK